MANRVTPEEVKEIIDTTVSESSIEAFITAANATINALLGSSSLTVVQLREIERWLTAHLITCAKERTIRSETAGQADITYETQPLGKGLDASLYGQQVRLLDTTGILASVAVGMQKVSMYTITSFEGKNDTLY
jgi:hypothetical protein